MRCLEKTVRSEAERETFPVISQLPCEVHDGMEEGGDRWKLIDWAGEKREGGRENIICELRCSKNIRLKKSMFMAIR